MRVLLSHHKVLIALELDDRKWTAKQLARIDKIRCNIPNFFKELKSNFNVGHT